PNEVTAAQRYVLWLRLRDPETRQVALEELRSRIDTPGGELGYLPLALSFSLPVDRERAERAIKRQLARSAQATPELVAAIIALVLDLAGETPADALAFIERYRTIVAEHLDPASFVSIELRLLHEAGRTEAARKLLASESAQLLPEKLRAVLASSFGNADAEPSIEALEQMYVEEPQTATLLHLLRLYQQGPYTPRFLELARRLLRDLSHSRYALEFISYLSEQARDAEALELIDLLGPAVEADAALAAHAAWIHYRLGKLARAEALLARSEAEQGNPNLRALRLNLLISSGRWEAIHGFLEAQWRARAERQPEELARYASLAAQIGADRAGDFTREAAARAPDDPRILLTAYNAATLAGLEDKIEGAGAWLMRAAEQSGPDGPIQTLALEELIGQQPEWEERVETAWRDWARGALPLPGLGQLLGRPWLELHLTPLISNLEESEARRRQAVALFSGRQRGLADGLPLGASIAIDKSALVTLGVAQVLPEILSAFERVHAPHDVLGDLFEQQARIAFHQPSQIAFAHQLNDMIARKRLRPFAGETRMDVGLAEEIGRSLAMLLSEASAQEGGQHLVVHP
ncbi:MAG TPA: hypothetical protein VM915_16175, partial [Verrucomicrobiae bacterium]|nr:hypothetical protein [Verrucomicrobiae bacterium]